MTNNLKVDFVTDASRIRSLCINERWYECGTIEEYNKLLNFVDEHKTLDVDSLEVIAMDIYRHSHNKMDKSYTERELISNIKHIILNDACRFRLLGANVTSENYL